MPDPIFLVSTGRTGTKFLSDFFNRYGTDVSSYHAPGKTRIFHILSNLHQKGHVSESIILQVWKWLKSTEITNHQQQYIESNPYYYGILDTLRTIYPASRFIFIIRAPKPFIISHLSWERQRIGSKLANRLIPGWQPLPYVEQLQGIVNNTHQRVGVYSRIWTFKNTVIRDGIRDDELAITIKFEDIFETEDGYEHLATLLSWLDIEPASPIDTGVLDQHKNRSNRTAQLEWDRRCDQIMRHNCGRLMAEFGYVSENI